MNAPSKALLLDTCAAIWLANGTLSENVAARVIEAGMSEGIYVSPVSAWEVGMLARPKASRSALEFLPDAKSWFSRLMAGAGIKPAPFTSDIAIEASFLPGEVHGDPGDRLIIATARNMQLPIVTRDEKIIAYAAAGYVEVIPC